jgi:hypothetical protein
MQKKIKPKKLNVRRPDGAKLKSEGERVVWGPYWLRRLKAGEIEVLEVSTDNIEKNEELANDDII